MSEGTYGGAQQGGGLWFTQNANGVSYLWTGSAWVDPYSAEGQSAMADPSSYMAGIMAQTTEGYWHTFGADGSQQTWTAGGWGPASSAGAYVDPAVPLEAAPMTPPAVGYGTSTDQLAAQLVESGDPVAVQMGFNLQEFQREAAEPWLRHPLEGIDSDMDDVDDPYDVQPLDADVQDTGDPDPYDGVF